MYPSGVASTAALLHLLKAGDHMLSSEEQYGGTRLLISDYVKIQGIGLDFVDSTNIKQIESAIKPNTKVSLHINTFSRLSELNFLNVFFLVDLGRNTIESMFKNLRHQGHSQIGSFTKTKNCFCRG